MFASNERAFNLFTALVSFILIILAVLLVTIMITSERTIVDSINDIAEGAELQAASDLARADAIQVFNYGIRYQIEVWLTSQANEYIMTNDKLEWNDVVQDFARGSFGSSERGSQFANRTAKHLSSLLSSAPQPLSSGFEISLISNEEKLRGILRDLFSQGIEEGTFFDVIACDNGDYNDCLGTFYVNLDIEKLSDEDYEDLPQLEVKNNNTGRRIRNPILPRGNFRIYVPLRVFKALAGGFALTHTGDALVPLENRSDDFGLFSARVHNELEEMRLGFCDRQVCMPRDNPYIRPEYGNWTGVNCTGKSRVGINASRANLLSRGIKSVSEYVANDSASTETALQRMAIDRIRFIGDEIVERELTNHDGFEIVVSDEGSYLNSVRVSPQSVASKKVETSFSIGEGRQLNPQSDVAYTANATLFSGTAVCPFSREGAGIYFKDGKIAYTDVVPECELIGGSAALYCTEVKKFDAIIKFEETNEQFKVSKNSSGVYTVRLTDGQFTPFTIKFANVVNRNNCALVAEPQATGNCNPEIVEQDWSCVSILETGAAPGGEAIDVKECRVKEEEEDGVVADEDGRVPISGKIAVGTEYEGGVVGDEDDRVPISGKITDDTS